MDVVLPRRLIDVQSVQYQGEDSVKIVDFEHGEVGNYTALSYSYEHSIRQDSAASAGLSGNCSTRTITTLPEVFHDAILLTRDLGIRYLWVGALCIPNDQFDNFARDSAAFGSIYENAYLTLAATGANGDSQGLFFPRKNTTYIPIPYETHNGTSGDLWMHRLLLTKEFMRNPATVLESEPLCKAAWTFQERVLSTRTVHFAGDQVYFECLKHFVSEDGLLMNECFHSTARALPNDADQNGLSRWFGIIWHYGTCSVSDPSDKLSALANIARAFRGILEDEYVAGLWKSSLIECLCWQSVDCTPVGEYRAPSWSWASVDGLVGMGFHTSTWERMATIEDIHVELQDNCKPFSEVKAAWIRLEAPVVPLIVSNTESYTGDIVLRVKDDKDSAGFHASFDTIGKSYSDVSEALLGKELLAVLLAETRDLDCSPGECGSEITYHGIIATPVGGTAGVLKRIGFIIAGPEEFGSKNWPSKKAITLV